MELPQTVTLDTLMERLRVFFSRYALPRVASWALLSLLLFTVCMRQFWPNLQAWTGVQGQNTPVTLPWTFKSLGNNTLNVQLHVNVLTPTTWQIVPDDQLRALTINEQSVSLTQIPAEKLRDFNQGFVIDLSPYLRQGDNHLAFQINNDSGNGGLQLRPVLGNLRWFLLGASFVPLLWGLAQIFKLRLFQTALIAFSLILICSYWNVTPWQARTYDVMTPGGHLDYVRFVATHWSIPKPTSGWTYYHPPLYYLLGALAWQWAEVFDLSHPETVQAMSLALWLIFLVSSAGALRYIINDGIGLALATLLLVSWPSGILHSIRIGNDLSMYATSGVATWFAVRWWQRKRQTDLLGMAIACALALLSKSSALALMGACGVMIMVPWLRHPTRLRFQNVVWFAMISGSGLALSFAVRVYYYLHGLLPNWLVGNANTLNSRLLVPNNGQAYLPVDLFTYLKSPWVSTWNDDTGRGNFWNFLLRSSLSGEFELPGQWPRLLAWVMGGVLLALTIHSLITYLFELRLRQAWRQLPLLLMATFWLASLLVLRIQFPYACSNDFRYILPIIVPAIVWWASSGKISQGLMAIMSALSLALFLPM